VQQKTTTRRMSDQLEDEHVVKTLDTGEGGADEIPMTFPQRVSSSLSYACYIVMLLYWG
jgi:hypothetical protein